VTVLLPTKAVSVISAPGQPFYDPQADAALYELLKANLRKDIAVVEMNEAINEPAFAERCANTLLSLISK
jgi:uncharacterized protein (UPF0261 family)